MRVFLRCLVVALLFGAALVTAPAADAYCRKTIAGGDGSYDPSVTGKCAGVNALPLYWEQSCIEFKVEVDSALEAQGKMTPDRAHAIMAHAASAWMTAQCATAHGSKGPAIRVLDVAQSRCPGAQGTPDSVVVFTAEPVTSDGLLAVTDVTFDTASGRVSVARMNVRDVYAELGASSPADIDARVEFVARHEMGHFLGLAHSQRTDAVMFASYDAQKSDALTPDDVNGICDAYGPDKPIGAGCRTAEGGDDAGWLVALAAALCALRGARRASRSRRISAALFALALVAYAAPAAAKPTTKKPTDGTTAKPVDEAPAKPPKKRRAPRTRRPKGAPRAPAPPKEEPPAPREEPTLADAPPAAPAVAPPAPSPPPEAASAAPLAPARDETPHAPLRGPRGADLFVGGRYRAFALPRGILDLFGRANRDLFFQGASVELEIRKERFSLVPAVSFADLSTGDLLVGSRNSDVASSFSYVRSDMKAVAASLGLVWSFPLSRVFDAELGVELGVAGAFGPLVDNWVYERSDGPLAYGGRRFAPCTTVSDGYGCRPQDHASPTPVRVGNYREPSFVNGGKAPSILPWVSLPLAGVRARIGENLALRIGIGASFTGIWAGAALDYRIARAER